MRSDKKSLLIHAIHRPGAGVGVPPFPFLPPLVPSVPMPSAPPSEKDDPEVEDDRLWEWERTYEHEKNFCRAEGTAEMRTRCWRRANERNSMCREGKNIPPFIY